jgi:hypothetical protein
MRYAVLASLLLHVLLLWPEPLRPPASEANAVLQATVRVLRPPPVPVSAGPVSARAVSPAPTPALLPVSPARQSPEPPHPLPETTPPVTATAATVPATAGPPGLTAARSTGAATPRRGRVVTDRERAIGRYPRRAARLPARHRQPGAPLQALPGGGEGVRLGRSHRGAPGGRCRGPATSGQRDAIQRPRGAGSRGAGHDRCRGRTCTTAGQPARSRICRVAAGRVQARRALGSVLI